MTNKPDHENLKKNPAACLWVSWQEDAAILHRRALRLTLGNKEEAEDLLSATLIKAVAHVKRNETIIREPRAFLLFAMRNEHVSRLRRLRSERQVRDFNADVYQDREEGMMTIQPDQENRLRHQDALKAVMSVISSLPLDSQKVFHLRFCEECSYGDIARALSITEVLARKRVQHLRQHLRQMLGDDLLDPVTGKNQRIKPGNQSSRLAS